MLPSSGLSSKHWTQILERKAIIKKGVSLRVVSRGGILGQVAPRKGKERGRAGNQN